MTTSFKISVPGKVILFGEHSVVYGKTAVAASLDQRTWLDYQQLPENESFIYLEMPKIDLTTKISLNQIREDKLFSIENLQNVNYDHDSTLSLVRKLVITLNQDATTQQKTSLECFFYAILQICRREKNFKLTPFRLKLDTELSVGAGQGSSASFSVSLVTCFLHLARLQKNPQTTYDLSQSDREEISNLAFDCEKIMHGAPSGIDNTICTFGSVVEFRKGDPPKFIPLTNSIGMQILLVDTKVGRSTKVLVDKLAKLKINFAEVFDPILETMDKIARRVVKLLKEMQRIKDDERYAAICKELSIIVDVNQCLLTACQVSHPSLDTICSKAKNYGFFAKLTGAGGGGFAYVFLPPDASESKTNDLSLELSSLGFSVIKTKLGGSGVEIFTK